MIPSFITLNRYHSFMRMAALFLAAAALAASGASAAPAAVCRGDLEPYPAALCLYLRGEYERARAGFEAIVAKDEARPETLKGRYFLARSLMKLRRWEEASGELIKIYSLSPAFYEEWSCDFLLGEARRGMGLE
ncbi:MAG TPA: CDC27 family protein [Thermoanaerobaculia bacterium]|nr:CDC27 family protein [Thermoanaerobaculia bacterium]